ncbi:Sec7 domain containing protein [Cladophialophora carrionii]|uniref:Sec7 domain containing protein n=1 Tax=Cladophialophora carrionii TaxID=86049 RepID=A0A1C1CFZ6_9EURO|nr:Sec7 domain containing protein [Cladophialophora carrionii]
MDAPPSMPSPKKPKSPRRQSSKQLTANECQNPQPASLPSSPVFPARPLRQLHGTQESKQMTGPGTFLAESPKMEDHEDVEDPHDLSLSRNHILRASMVDNLVLSLDHFSGGAFDDAPFTPRSNSYDTSTRVRGRGRGHTFSSSTSSENDVQHLRAAPQLPQTMPRIPLRSSVRYQKDLQRLPSIFGEDEDSTRAKVYDSQRAMQPRHPRRRKNVSDGGKSDHSSNSSSIDLGHLASMTGRLGGPGNRRSRSFDFGSRQREVRTSKPGVNGDGQAPTPVIYPGPEAQKGEPPSPLVRKNSTKSSKSAYVKKGRMPPTGANATRTDSVPQLPSMKSVPSFHATDHKPSMASLSEPIAAPRPGFFRRVFGSKNPTVEPQSVHNVLTKSYHGRATPVQEDSSHHPTTPPGKMHRPVRRTSTDASANKENQPVLAKKSSAFFRRRKKSISHAVPPPLPLTLNAEVPAETQPVDGTSPVSSLRAFMGPYLADPPSSATGHGRPHGHVRTNSMQGFYTPTLSPPAFGLPSQAGTRPKAGHSRNESHSSNRSNKTLRSNPKPTSTLLIPHQDSFFADSSSAEEPMKRPFDTPSDHERREPRLRHSVNDLKLEQTASATSLPSPLSNPRSATTRQGSWISDTVSPTSSFIASASAPADTDPGPKPFSTRRQNTLEIPRKPVKGSPFASTSDVGEEYRSAPSTPLIVETPEAELARSPPSFNSIAPTVSLSDVPDYKRKAQNIYDHTDDEVDPSVAGAWLGDAGVDRSHVRKAFMELFDWKNQDILDSLRGLCDNITLKGESQVIDRVLTAFAQRWCECNPSHNFKSSDVVHSIVYALLLLNTDLHLADIVQKMTKAQFVRNAMNTIKRGVQELGSDKSSRGPKRANSSSHDDTARASSDLQRPSDQSSRPEPPAPESHESATGLAANRVWEMQIESVLKSFYNSISQEPLPLSGAQIEPNAHLNLSNNFLTIGTNMLRRTPSVLSKAHSDTNRGRFAGESKSLGARFVSKTRSRPRLPSAPGFNSSRTSIDESSAWSPSLSSTWSKVSLGKTLTSMSVDSFGTEATHADYQSSIGFASALSQAIIREDQLDLPIEDGPKAGSLLEDESLELCGAPWAKEGILKHKCHLEGVDKRSKDRNWNDCFAVIEKGYMRLFSFSMTAKSLRNKARAPKPAVVGGGNWQDNAEELWKFTLRHTIASSLPPPGYSKARPYVWALSLPTGAVHLFSVGTPDIVKEFVSTANFWSARLSKEPMMGGISNMEYGWSDNVVNRALASPEISGGRAGVVSPRPSTQMSMRSSMDHVGGVRPKLPGDKVHISDWTPPQQSMFASQLMEVDQLRALQAYVTNVEEELQKHNDLRSLMLLAYTAKHPNANKAMNNWEKKSSYLLREIVKFRTYIDTLQNAHAMKEKIYCMRKEEEEAQRAEADSRMRTEAANALMGVF